MPGAERAHCSARARARPIRQVLMTGGAVALAVSCTAVVGVLLGALVERIARRSTPAVEHLPHAAAHAMVDDDESDSDEGDDDDDDLRLMLVVRQDLKMGRGKACGTTRSTAISP